MSERWTETHGDYVWHYERDEERNETVMTPIPKSQIGKSEREKILDIMRDINERIEDVKRRA